MEIVLCHRQPERSIIWNGVPILCYRCFGILLTWQILLYLLIILRFGVDLNVLRMFPISIFWIMITIILVIPLVLDGYTQKWSWRMSNNPLRLITGVLFGLGTQIWILWLVLGVNNFIELMSGFLI